MSTPRTHTFTWHDTALTSAQARGLGGRDYLERMLRGEIAPPPFVAMLGFSLAEVGDGRVVFVAEPREYMQNGVGVLHGGATATLFDTTVGCACLTVVPADKIAMTMDLQVRYFRPLTTASGTLRCEGNILHIGRTTVTAEGRLLDINGRLCGHATSTLALIKPS